MSIKEFDDHIQGIFGLRYVHVVEEPVEKSFPDVQFGIYSCFDKLFVRVERGAQFKASRSRDDQRGRKLRQNFWRFHWRDHRIFRVSAVEITQGRPLWRWPRRYHPSLPQR